MEVVGEFISEGMLDNPGEQNIEISQENDEQVCSSLLVVFVEYLASQLWCKPPFLQLALTAGSQGQSTKSDDIPFDDIRGRKWDSASVHDFQHPSQRTLSRRTGGGKSE